MIGRFAGLGSAGYFARGVWVRPSGWRYANTRAIRRCCQRRVSPARQPTDCGTGAGERAERSQFDNFASDASLSDPARQSTDCGTRAGESANEQGRGASADLRSGNVASRTAALADCGDEAGRAKVRQASAVTDRRGSFSRQNADRRRLPSSCTAAEGCGTTEELFARMAEQNYTETDTSRFVRIAKLQSAQAKAFLFARQTRSHSA